MFPGVALEEHEAVSAGHDRIVGQTGGTVGLEIAI
jgi:hypothetical protein